MKDLKTMKRKSLFKTIASSLLVASVILFSACGNDDEVNKNTAANDGAVNVSKGLVFKVNFADYNSTDTLQTRAGAKSDTLGKEVVELSNGLLAEVTVKKDTENLRQEAAATTRALANDTYTMLAYQGGVLKGTLTGTVASGVFTPTNAGNKPMRLETGTYDFVLFNSAVSRSGNLLTVNQANGANAFIGRTTYNVTSTPSLQEVPFNMQRSVARMKIQLTAYMDIAAATAATLSSINATDVPGTRTYDASTGVWTSEAGASISKNLTFPASTETKYESVTYTSRSNEYAYFLPSTNPSKLKLKFTGGTIYNLNMANAELNLSVPTLTSMTANGSYVVNVKLMYNFLYLMSDGTTGTVKATTYGGGSKTPVGVVVSRSNRLAVALKDANNGAPAAWYDSVFSSFTQKNNRLYSLQDAANSYSDMDGYKYTWERTGSLDGITIKANDQSTYPALYYAGNYGNELRASGIILSGGMQNKKWHLPSNGEWTYVFTALGFGDRAALTTYYKYYSWYGNLASVAFTQVGGTAPLNVGYWTSTEITGNGAGNVVCYGRDMIWMAHGKTNSTDRMRAFVHY